MEFDWSPEKNRRNREKHGISFEEAVRVFEREAECVELYDLDHSDFEDRFITIGPVSSGLVLVVWTEREGDVIRVISARWATPRERDLYRRYMENQR